MTDEPFWTKWSAIGQILGAAGTFAAVVVSLHLARRAEKPKLKLECGVRVIIDPLYQGKGPRPRVVDITARNYGHLTAHISQYGWQTGLWFLKWPNWLTKQFAIQIPGDTGLGTNPPLELAPGTRRSSILNLTQFIDGIKKKTGEPFFARRWPIFGLRPTSIYVVAHLESGVTIRQRVEKVFEKVLFEAEAERLKELELP